MSAPVDHAEEFRGYAHPERLVTTQWVAEHIGDDDVVVLESNEDILLYETGHIPGALKIDWHTELNDPITRDFLDADAFAALMQAKGITADTTVVLYGDKSNWWAAYALWVFTLYGHDDVRLMNGGRDGWIAEGRELTTEIPAARTVGPYPVRQRDDRTDRAFRDDVLAHLGKPLVDVRSEPEYTGERTHMVDYPEEGALRGGHIAGAVSVPWARAATEDGRFKPAEELAAIYRDEAGLGDSDQVIAYCRIGERSSHTWFVLKYLLGYPNVRNYDGSWTEWGNLVGAPICTGSEPGQAPARPEREN